jgi:6-pyruvoyl-tetrahydropterin synthase
MDDDVIGVTMKSEFAVSEFAIEVAKENMKFSAAHFIAYPGFREPLHGHNYQVGVRVEGKLAATGYVIDFGIIKKIIEAIVAGIDERTIVPANSDCLKIDRPNDRQVRVRYESDEFIFPVADVAMLPIVHSSAEELARYIWAELVAGLKSHNASREAEVIEISVAEGPGQAAIYRHSVD